MTALGQALLMARRYEESQQSMLKASELDPNYFPAHLMLGDVYAANGMFAQSLTELQKAASVSPGDPQVPSFLGYVYAKSGRKQDAERVLKEMKAESQHKYCSARLTLVQRRLRHRRPPRASFTRSPRVRSRSQETDV